ncbi:helix-turn-helix transcriptional regulator, partial [Mediterraneibacter faecis]|uniref:helix-turn-helix domain-containing protein n=1 Tax=Mediterraneibacter faecis TaxID=592978 RepID=UPI002FE6CA28
MYFLGRIILVDEEVKQVLADNLIFLRNIKGLTQEQVAEVIGISRQSYSKWEQGETYPDIDKCD